MRDKKALLPALIAQAIYYVLYIPSLFDLGYSGEGMGRGFLLWIISFFPAFISILLHILGAALNITREKRALPIIYLLFSIAAIPLLITVGATGDTVDSIIWNVYYLVLLMIALISKYPRGLMLRSSPRKANLPIRDQMKGRR